ncbi:MAG: hypothetical protein NC238_00025, partial [Dehalobacter sp.]|nr:hypothetical protein [Dehalobacter sp.]
ALCKGLHFLHYLHCFLIVPKGEMTVTLTQGRNWLVVKVQRFRAGFAPKYSTNVLFREGGE